MRTSRIDRAAVPRRPLRTVALAAALTVLLAACSDAGDAEATACEPGQTDGDLLLYNWTDYIDPGLVAAFEAEYGVRVTEDYYASNEELIARVAAGGAQYDVVVPSDYAVSLMVADGLLRPLDRSALTNFGNIDPAFLDPAYDPGNAHSIPYLWGTTGLGVNVALLGDVEPSWALVFDPQVAGALPGRVALLDDPREVLGAALRYLGYSANTTSETELEAAADLVRRARSWVAAFDSNLYSELLLNREVVIAMAFSGNFIADLGEEEDFAYLLPKEGATLYTDNLAILARAPHPCTAHTFIDFILRPESGAALTEYIYYPSANTAAEALVDPEIRANPSVYPDDDTREILEYLEDTGDFETRYVEWFLRATG
jgi:spermidine/putrescine-binding protein